MTTLAIAVVAHPKRAQQAIRLADELGAHIIMDDAEYGDAVNHARAWEWLAAQDTDWALAIEDDAILGEKFTQRLIERIDALPEPGVLLAYTGDHAPTRASAKARQAHQQAEVHGHTYIRLTDASWGVAIALPTARITNLPAALRRGSAPSDHALGYWARTSARLPIYACHPDLVDHADTPSLVWATTRGPRKALWFRG